MKQSMPLILRGDTRTLPLADASVDLIVTSPPYWSLRSYTDGGEHYDGQVGAETTPREFIEALLACTREWMRVLKLGGSLFVNLGDKYNAYNGGRGEGTIQGNGVRQSLPRGHGLDAKGVRPKSLLLIPERYRIACTDELGLIARAVIVWSKPNGLPESVTDRVRRSHEDWVHLTKSPRYYAAVDEIREPHIHGGVGMSWAERKCAGQATRHGDTGGGASAGAPGPKAGNALGKLPCSVWEIATQPLKVPASLGVDHFAAFPMEWPRRLILGWSPREVCTVCGEGRRPVAQREPMVWRESPTIAGRSTADATRKPMSGTMLRPSTTTITGYACACPDTSAPSIPGVVLDPFSGTGTTALVATMLGRTGIGVDLSADYCRLARWRSSDPKERARAAGLDPDQVSKIVPSLPGQLDMFGEVAS